MALAVGAATPSTDGRGLAVVAERADVAEAAVAVVVTTSWT